MHWESFWQLKVQQEHLTKIDFSVLVYHSMALYHVTQILHDIYPYIKGQMPMRKKKQFIFGTKFITNLYKLQLDQLNKDHQQCLLSLVVKSETIKFLLAHRPTVQIQPTNNAFLTHWDRVTHICVSKIIIIVLGNGFSPDRHQAIMSWGKSQYEK